MEQLQGLSRRDALPCACSHLHLVDYMTVKMHATTRHKGHDLKDPELHIPTAALICVSPPNFRIVK